MDIDNLTIGQIRELSKLFATNGAEPSPSFVSPHVGKYVIVRSRDSGVQCGVLMNHSGNQVVLNDARRLWSWKAKKNHTLSAVAIFGIHECSKLSPGLDGFHVIGVCEILPCTQESSISLQLINSHEQ